MITFYKVNGHICFSDRDDLDFVKVEEPWGVEKLTWLFEREPGSCRASFNVNDKALLSVAEENVSWLNSNKLAEVEPIEVPEWVENLIAAGKVRAVNMAHPKFLEILAFEPKQGKKRVNILAIGDVGSMLLTGLHLLGGDVVESIGICDLEEKVTARWEFEENQIAYPWAYDALPEVHVVKPEELFDCDVFVFVASKGIPAVGSGIKDVRMYQFEKIEKIELECMVQVL